MPTEKVTLETLDAGIRREITTVKRPIMDLARKFGAIREKLSELAPKVMRIYNRITADHPGFQFVEFARMIDTSIPTHRDPRDGKDGYNVHPTYTTLAYMRRLLTTPRRGRQGVRDNATDALARSLATVLQVVEDTERVWDAIKAEFPEWTERLITRLRKRVAAAKPFITLDAPRPVKLGKVIHMDRVVAPQAEQTGAEPMRQPGRRLVLRAPAANAGRKRKAA